MRRGYMKKRTLLIILLIFVAVFALTAAAPAKTKLARLEIINKTDGEVQVTLTGGGYHYFLVVGPKTSKTFTVERENYRMSIYSCDGRQRRRLDTTTNKTLVIGPCKNPAISSLTMINKTNEKVELSLTRPGRRRDNFYFLSVDPLTTKTFTIPPALYAQRTFSCGKSASGFLDLENNTRLVFTSCGEPAPNKGEPTQEKVHIDDSPGETLYWRYFNYE
jgi:hypothetical protein